MKPHGSFPETISPAKDLIDFWLTHVPRFYLEVERFRPWINWDKRIYLSFIKRGDTVLDVGANTGRHTVMFSHLAGKSGRVIAFEPVAANVARLRENVRTRSRFQNVDISRMALGNPGAERKEAVILAPGEDLTQGSLRPQAGGSWMKTDDIREHSCVLSSVDAEVSRSSRIDFLKIDVEGGELDVLKGAVSTLSKHQPLIYAEVDQKWMSSFGHTVGELFDFARSLGYSGARLIDENGVHDVSESNPTADTLPLSANVLFFAARHTKVVKSFDKLNRGETAPASEITPPARARVLGKRLIFQGVNVLARLARPWLGSGGPPRSEGAVARILVVELWNIGDVVLVTPFLSQLRARFPTAEITLLAQPHAEILLRGSNLVDRFVPADLAWTDGGDRGNPLSYNWRELRRILRILRERRFDIAFQCRPHVREHLILGLSGAHRRVGYAFGTGDHLLTDAVEVDDTRLHKSEAWLKLLAPLGGSSETVTPPLHVTAEERRWAREFLAANGVSPSDVVVGVHPGASVAEKRWPLDRFRELAGELARRQDLRVVAFSDPAGLGQSLREVPGVIGASVGLRALVALIDGCDILVCNDSGPMHIAGALGIPTVGIFQSGIDRLFAPLGEGHELVVAEERLDRVAVSRVLAAVDRVLQRARAKPDGSGYLQKRVSGPSSG